MVIWSSVFVATRSIIIIAAHWHLPNTFNSLIKIELKQKNFNEFFSYPLKDIFLLVRILQFDLLRSEEKKLVKNWWESVLLLKSMTFVLLEPLFSFIQLNIIVKVVCVWYYGTNEQNVTKWRRKIFLIIMITLQLSNIYYSVYSVHIKWSKFDYRA